MNLDRLRLFLCVVDAGSVTAAAKTAHLTQPALSRNLQLLEQELGVPLFGRRGRGLVLTAAGRSLEPRARELLARVGVVTQEVSRAAERSYHDLRLGTVDSVATFLLPGALETLRAAFPSLVVQLITGRTAALLERLGEGALDVAVVAYSGPPPEAGSLPLGPYALRYFGRADRFGALKHVHTREGLHPFPVVELAPPPGQLPVTPSPFHSRAQGSNIATVKALVLSGFGVGDLPDFVLSPEERRRLVAAPLVHDVSCGLFLSVGAAFGGEAERRIVETLASALKAQLAPGRVGAPGASPAARPSQGKRPRSAKAVPLSA